MKRTYKTLAVLSLTLSLSTIAITAYASQWTQDTAGWKVQSDDGTYLISQWYQSPESGLWYYIGADGYMLTTTTTPDGFYVNADGVWVESSESVQQPTQPIQQPTVEPGSTVKDANGNEVHRGKLDTNQTLSDEQIEAINNSQWN